MATKRKGYMTLEEHHAQLKAEGKWEDYLKRKEAQEAERRKHEQVNSLAEAPIVAELRNVGVEVNSVWDLVNTSSSYTRALPILLAHLQRVYPDAIRSGLARALGVREAKYAWPTLMKLYLEEPESQTKHGLAVALSIVADDDLIDHLIAAAKDAINGESRIFLLKPICRSRLPQARAAVTELKADPVLRKEMVALERKR